MPMTECALCGDEMAIKPEHHIEGEGADPVHDRCLRAVITAFAR